MKSHESDLDSAEKDHKELGPRSKDTALRSNIPVSTRAGLDGDTTGPQLFISRLNNSDAFKDRKGKSVTVGFDPNATVNTQATSGMLTQLKKPVVAFGKRGSVQL